MEEQNREKQESHSERQVPQDSKEGRREEEEEGLNILSGKKDDAGIFIP